MQLQTAESFASESGTNLRRQLNQVRAILGEAAPNQVPIKASPRPKWMDK